MFNVGEVLQGDPKRLSDPPKTYAIIPVRPSRQIWDQSMPALLDPLLVFGGKGTFDNQQSQASKYADCLSRSGRHQPIYSMFTSENYLNRGKLSRCQRPILSL